MRAVLFIAAVCVASTLGLTLRKDMAPLSLDEDIDFKRGPPKIDTYVINVDSNKARCECMQKQLAFAPQAVYRHSANKKEDCGLQPDWGTMDGERNHEAEQSLFCSNFKVWEKASQSDADFIVVFEDDSLMKSDFWEKVTNMVSSECMENIDYLVVDMFRIFNENENRRDDVCGSEAKLLQIPKELWVGGGAHTQIIRKTYLQDLMQMARDVGAGTPDQWIKKHMPGNKFFLWQPLIVTQSIALTKAQFTSFSGCSEETVKSALGEENEVMPTEKQEAFRIDAENRPKDAPKVAAPRMQC